MTDHTITDRQMQCVVTLFLLGSLILVAYNKELNQDSWASFLIAAVIILPIICVYSRIVYLYPGQNIFEVLTKIFGNIAGKILSFLMVLYSIYLGALIFKNFSQAIRILNLPDMPEILIFTFLLLASSFSVANGPENIGRLSKYIQPIFVVSIFATVIIGFKDMNFNNIKPILNTDFKIMLNESFTLCAVSFGEIVVCLPLFASVSSLTNPLKTFLKGIGVATAIFIIVSLRNILILGTPSEDMFYFPSYEALSVLSVGDFLTRMEALISANLVMAGFIKICVCLYMASLGLTKILNFPNQKTAIIPCGLIMITLAGLLYSNTLQMIDFVQFYRYYAIPFQIILPLVILIGAEIQTRKKTSSAAT